MIADSHIHMGQFYETYTSPREISLLMDSLGVERYAVSSTTTCEKNFGKVVEEFMNLIRIDGNRAYPVLWLSPEFFIDESVKDLYLSSEIRWSAIKIHPDWQPKIWLDVELQTEMLKLARTLKVPILIHTGSQEYSESSIWEGLIRDNPTQSFILAHCRPFNQAFDLLKRYKNAYGDLAFVDTDNFHRLHDSGICNRILWGSDFPIVSHYVASVTNEYYLNQLSSLANTVNDEEYTRITKDNFNTLFR